MLTVVCGAALASEPVIEDVSGGVIDWSALRLEVTITSNHSRGAWQDRRLQEQDALDQLNARMSYLAGEVPITAELTAGDIMSAGGDLGDRLSAGADRWTVEEARYYTRGGVELVGVLDLRTWLWPALVELAEGEPLPEAEAAAATGLLVDARGLDVDLSMCPTLQTASGVTVLSPVLYSDDAARRRAPVLYVSDPADPRAAKRAGSAPMMVQAASVDESGAIVLGTPGARLAKDATVSAIVSRGDVVIVVSP